MNYDKFGQPHLTESQLADLLYQNPDLDISAVPIVDPDKFNTSVRHFFLDLPKLQQYKINNDFTVEEFDKDNQQNWFMPKKYYSIDIDNYVLNLCKTDIERQRVQAELILFKKYHFEKVLQYLIYLVDTLRQNRIVWGLGRGSSVASYVLYLIGIHKIDSIKFNLDINEFLK